jgi:hypothetical protein
MAAAALPVASEGFERMSAGTSCLVSQRSSWGTSWWRVSSSRCCATHTHSFGAGIVRTEAGLQQPKPAADDSLKGCLLAVQLQQWLGTGVVHSGNSSRQGLDPV